MDPYPLMPALLNGVAGFFLAFSSLALPITAITYGDEAPTLRRATESRTFETRAEKPLTPGAS